jgi:hypothetical protein
MTSTFTFEKNGMAIQVVVQDGSVVCTVEGAEVYQLRDKETGKCSLAAFQNPQAYRTLSAEGKYFSQKIS